jgi:leucyl aminopeptidase
MNKMKFSTKYIDHANTWIVATRESEWNTDLFNTKLEELGIKTYDYKDQFKGDYKSSLYIKAKENVFLVGLGKGNQNLKQAFRHYFNKLKLGETVNVFAQLNTQDLKDAVNGMALASYGIDHLKEKKAEKSLPTEIGMELGENKMKAVQEGLKLAEYQAQIMKWMDLPANHKSPKQVAEWMKTGAEKVGIEVKIFDELQCRQEGFHALLAVGQGSSLEPVRMVRMHYKPKNTRSKIALVGKGVTFDTGGISLKPGDNMNYMKSDMGGAAAVYGALCMAASHNLNVEIIGICPLTENCIDGTAIKPGDVISSYLGKTIEVINTDAEGRLILADALAYVIKNDQPDHVIDLATLTGNCIAALGYHASALMSKNDELIKKIEQAAEISQEKVWRMPLWDDYTDMMKSDIADIKNLSSAPIAGAITAAKFLEAFTLEHASWAHLDIAGMAFGDSEYGSMKSATAYGVSLIYQFLKEINQ